MILDPTVEVDGNVDVAPTLDLDDEVEVEGNGGVERVYVAVDLNGGVKRRNVNEERQAS